MGDTDNTIALTMAQFVCDQRGKNGDPTSMKAFVVAAVGPGEDGGIGQHQGGTR